MNSCMLKHRPPVLPQDAVFQLFKPRLILAAQPLEGKAGRIPVITVWLVEWMQLASLSREDLHTYKKLGEARCGSCKASCVKRSTLRVRRKKILFNWTNYPTNAVENIYKNNDVMSMMARVFQPHPCVITAKSAPTMKPISSNTNISEESLCFLYSICGLPHRQPSLSSGPPLS